MVLLVGWYAYPLLESGNVELVRRETLNMDDDTLFAFTAAGYFSLSGTHYCRKALWDSTVSDESEFKGRGRYKRLIVLRALVWLSYGSATLDFFIIAPLSIPL